MKKIIGVLTLSALSVLAVEYSLKQDQFISHILWDKKHIDYKWDLSKIAAVLKHNGITWESAKRLPVGYTFEVPDEDVPQVANKEVQSVSVILSGNEKNQGTLSAMIDQETVSGDRELKLGVTTGVFHEELGFLNGQDKFIYSNMSQKVGLLFESNKDNDTFYTLGLNFRNHVYNADRSYGINQNIQKVTHSLFAGVTYRKYHTWKVMGFAENENKLFFDVQADKTSELKVGNSTNLGVAAEWSPWYIASSLWGIGTNITGSVVSNELDRNNEYRVYVFTELYEAGIRADLGYSFTDLEVSSQSVRNRQVELNLNYFFL